jgi:hypothetical protein
LALAPLTGLTPDATRVAPHVSAIGLALAPLDAARSGLTLDAPPWEPRVSLDAAHTLSLDAARVAPPWAPRVVAAAARESEGESDAAPECAPCLVPVGARTLTGLAVCRDMRPEGGTRPSAEAGDGTETGDGAETGYSEEDGGGKSV